MAAATLLDLPAEILQEIAAWADSIQGVSSLLRINRQCYEILSQTIFKLDAQDFRPRALLWAAANGDLEVAERALAAGTDINVVPGALFRFRRGDVNEVLTTDTTPLLAAVEYGHVELVRRFLDLGANERWRNRHGEHVLYLAAKKSHRELVELFIARCSDLLYDRPVRGELPIMEATHDEATHHLMLERMDITMCGTSFEAAAMRGDERTMSTLIKRGIELNVDRWNTYDIQLLCKVCCDPSEATIRIAEFLIQCGMDINGRGSLDYKDATPLYHACLSHSPYGLDMARMLVKNGADVTSVGSSFDGDTPLSAAVAQGNIALANFLLSKTQNPAEAYDILVDIPRLYQGACRSGNIECLDLILKHFPTDLASETGGELLTAACAAENTDIISSLLESGAPVHGHGRQSPLSQAWRTGNMEALELLLAAGADPNTGVDGKPLLCEPPWPKVSDMEQIACLKRVLAAGADPKAKGFTGLTPLHVACAYGAMGCVKLLLEEHRVDASATSIDGITPLHLAVKSGKLELVKILVARGADVHGGYGHNRNAPRTALHEACLISKLDDMTAMIEYLLSHNVDAKCETSVWVNLLGMSWGYLQESAPNDTAICLLLKNGNVTEPIPVLKALVDRDPGSLDAALQLACRGGMFNVVKFLLEAGADPNNNARVSTLLYPSNYVRTSTPLCQAAAAAAGSKTPSAAVVKLLLSYGADIHARDGSGETALGVSLQFHSPSVECLRVLVSAGAELGNAFGPVASPGDEPLFVGGKLTGDERRKSIDRVLDEILRGGLVSTVVEFLMEEGGLLSEFGPERWQNLLVQAALHGNARLMQLLVGNGLADIDLPDDKGETVDDHVDYGAYEDPYVFDIVNYIRAQKRKST